jgi:threonine/homoserine/homoserine lactone efflux protein
VPIEAFIALSVFAFVSSITPGPNNLMLLASGMNFGFRATIPHMLGISLGFFVMELAVGLGLAEAFARYPMVYTLMNWAGGAYLLYLAWRIANAGVVRAGDKTTAAGKPLGFFGAAAFQWVNPKAWAMAVSAFSIYVPPPLSWMLVVGVSALFAIINLPCVSSWALFGSGLRHWLREPHYARVFNIAMALLLVASMLPMVGVV